MGLGSLTLESGGEKFTGRVSVSAFHLLWLYLPPLSLRQGQIGGGVWHVSLILKASADGVLEMAEIYVSLTKAGGDRGEASLSSRGGSCRGGGASGVGAPGAGCTSEEGCHPPPWPRPSEEPVLG